MSKLQVVVPTAVGIVALVVAVRAMDFGAPPQANGPVAAPATPYSAAHAAVQSGPGEAEEPAPTF